MSEILKHTTSLIQKDFEIETPDGDFTESQLLELLAARIKYLIDRRMEYLFQILYRLDIKESKVDFALNPKNPESAHITLAKLIIERQKEKAITRMQYKAPDLGDEWN